MKQEDALDHERVRRKKRPAVWQLVRENIYTHRQRKEQDEDDIMICQCRRPTDGGAGCGPDCLNRLLNIECVPVSTSPRHCHVDNCQSWSLQPSAPDFKRMAVCNAVCAGAGILPLRGDLQQPDVLKEAVCKAGQGEQQFR